MDFCSSPSFLKKEEMFAIVVSVSKNACVKKKRKEKKRKTFPAFVQWCFMISMPS